MKDRELVRWCFDNQFNITFQPTGWIAEKRMGNEDSQHELTIIEEDGMYTASLEVARVEQVEGRYTQSQDAYVIHNWVVLELQYMEEEYEAIQWVDDEVATPKTYEEPLTVKYTVREGNKTLTTEQIVALVESYISKDEVVGSINKADLSHDKEEAPLEKDYDKRLNSKEFFTFDKVAYNSWTDELEFLNSLLDQERLANDPNLAGNIDGTKNDKRHVMIFNAEDIIPLSGVSYYDKIEAFLTGQNAI